MTKENFTAITVVLDESGSMEPLITDTIGSFNTFLREQKAVSGDANLTLALFNDRYNLVHDFIPLKDVPELSDNTYKPSGSTALLDAVGQTIDRLGNRLSSMSEEERPSKVLLLIITDGEENSSREYKHEKIKEMIKHQQEKYSWSVAYVGANVDAFSVGGSMGVARGSSYNYVNTSAGTTSLYSAISAGTTSFRNSAVGTSFNMSDPTQDTSVSNVIVPPSIPINPSKDSQ